jgi:ATP-dependent protease ClpP protease subunit
MNLAKAFISSMIDAGLTKNEAETVAKVRFHKSAKQRTGDILLAKEDGVAEILLYEEIGFDFMTGEGWTPKRLIDELSAMKPFDSIMLRINSPGGSAFDGITIYNILQRQEKPIAGDIEGIAASAASFIAQAADPGKLAIADAGSVMIHRAQAIAMGDANLMLEMADIMSRLDDKLADIYAARSGVDASDWLDAMSKETWYFGSEAVDAKLADSVTQSKRIAARADWDQFNYQHVPSRLVAKAEPVIVPDEAAAARIAARLKELA